MANDDNTIENEALSAAEQEDLKHTSPIDPDCDPTIGDMSDPDREELQERIRRRMDRPSGARIRKDPLIGQVFGGRFEIVSKVGTGGMGVVYKARQKGMDRYVAIKVLLKDYLTNDTAVRRFEREALAVSKLEHPNTIRIYDFGETDTGQLYIAMEFLTGAPLARLLTEQRQLPVRQTLRVVRQMCLSLQEAHAKGIIHRDLKPDNVFVDAIGGQKDFTKVLDFGVAKLREGIDEGGTLTQHGVIFGTPKYMSPEQCKSQGVDPRSDLYSVGVMMYEMLAGRVPFAADNSMAILIMHANDIADSLTEVRPDLVIPFEVEELMHRLLSKEPDDRPRDAAAVVAECDALLRRVPDEFEQVLTYQKAEEAGMGFDRSQAYTMPDRGTPLSDSERERLRARDDAMARETIAVHTDPFPTPLWKKLVAAAVVLLALAGGAAGYLYSQITGIPAEARAMIPERWPAGTLAAPSASLVAVTASTNAANVTIVDDRGNIVGMLDAPDTPKTFKWLAEPGRQVTLTFKHGAAEPITRTVDLGKGGTLEQVAFEIPTDAPEVVVEKVTMTVKANVGGAWVRIAGMDTAWPIAEGETSRTIELVKGADAMAVTVEKPGFLSASASFVPEADGAVTVALEPDPAAAAPEAGPPPAKITLNTNVGDVEVKVVSTGQLYKTPKRRGEPLTIELPFGDAPVELSFERRGYDSTTTTVTPNADQTVAVTLDRRKSRPSGDKPTGSTKPAGNKPPPEKKPDGPIKIGPIKRIK